MGVLATLFRKQAATNSGSYPPSDHGLAALFGYTPTAAGVPVTEYTAMNCTALWAGINLIGGTLGSLPLLTYRRRKSGGKDRATAHRVYKIVHDGPNEEMTSMAWRETGQSHLLTWGNTYGEIETDMAGRAQAVWPLTPNRVKARRDPTTKTLYYEIDGGPRRLPPDKVFHVPGLGYDGLVGYSPVAIARQAIGLYQALELHGATYFGNGSRPGGWIRHPKVLKSPAAARLREDWERIHQGPYNAHRIGVLEEGAEFVPMQFPNDDAQFLQSRKFSVVEIARILNMPPYLLRDLERGASYASIEAQGIEFVVYTLRLWMIRWEQEINRKLFTPDEREEYFAEHLVDGLLRGDIQARYAAYAIARQNGWLNADEIREFENLNPIADGSGKVYFINGNMRPTDQAAEEPEPPAAPPALPNPKLPPADDTAQQRIRSATNALFVEALSRMVRKEAAAARRAAKEPAKFLAWLDDFYPKHEATLKAVLLPAVRMHLACHGTDHAPEALTARIARDEAERSRLELLEVAGASTAKDLEANVSALLDRWELERPDALAARVMRKEEPAHAA